MAEICRKASIMKNKHDPGQKREQNRLSREVYNEIRKTIFLSDHVPGQKLEYRKMAESMGMSPTPVVQALKHMELLDLVRHEPNRGFYIIEITAGQVAEAYRLRETLELSLVPDIIGNLDADGERTLEEVLDDYNKASINSHIKLRWSKDIKFHMTIAELSNQPLTVWVLRYLFDFLYLNRFSPGFYYYRPNNAANHEHQDILDAILARDVDAAREAISCHIRNICSDTLQMMKAKEVGVDQIDF